LETTIFIKQFDYLDLALVFVLATGFVVCFLGLLTFLETVFLVVFLTILRFTLGFLEVVDLRLIEDDFLVLIYMFLK